MLSEDDAKKKYSPKDTQPQNPPFIWYTYECVCLELKNKNLLGPRKKTSNPCNAGVQDNVEFPISAESVPRRPPAAGV